MRYFNVTHFLDVIVLRWRNFFRAITIFWGSIVKLRVATPPQISSDMKFLLKSPLISSKNVDFQENPLKSPQIQKIQNSILAILLLNNTNNLGVRAVKHNYIRPSWEYFIVLFNCLFVKYFIIWHNNIRMCSTHLS